MVPKSTTRNATQCHGAQGLGDGPQAAQLSVPVATLGLSDFARLYTPAEWYSVVTQGNMEKFMPAFANLTDRQRWDVVAYAMSLSAPKELISQGQALYQENCVSCHDADGKGNGPEADQLVDPAARFHRPGFHGVELFHRLYQAITCRHCTEYACLYEYPGSRMSVGRWWLISAR